MPRCPGCRVCQQHACSTVSPNDLHALTCSSYRCNKTPAQKFTFQNHKGVTKIQVGEEKDYCLNRENWNQPSRFVIRPCNEGPRFPTNLDMFENPREEYVEGVDNPYSSPGVDPNRIVLWWSADTACPGEDPVNCHPPPTCVDLPDGKKENGARIQTWQCFHGNTNQRWTATEHK